VVGTSYDPLETLGAVLSAFGIMVILLTEGRAMGSGLLLIALGAVVWKMGETRRGLNEKIEALKAELESLKVQRGNLDG